MDEDELAVVDGLSLLLGGAGRDGGELRQGGVGAAHAHGDARQDAGDAAAVLGGSHGAVLVGHTALVQLDDAHVVAARRFPGLHQLHGAVHGPLGLDPLHQLGQLLVGHVRGAGQVVDGVLLDALQSGLQGGGVVGAGGDDHQIHQTGAAPVAAGKALSDIFLVCLPQLGGDQGLAAEGVDAVLLGVPHEQGHIALLAPVGHLLSRLLKGDLQRGQPDGCCHVIHLSF